MTEECISNSYVYLGLENSPSKTGGDKALQKTQKDYVPGLSFRIKFNQFSALDKWEQSQCINALKCFQSEKDRDKFNQSQQFSLSIYNVSNINCHFFRP